jgi:hypothetical protein
VRGLTVHLTRPFRRPLILKPAADLVRSTPALMAANATLRNHLLVLRRPISRPQRSPMDRFRLVLLATMVAGWKQTLLMVQPDTVRH